MTLAVRRRLPGVRIEARAAELAESLPRMDIAGFCGFAARGPVHQPVAIEDPAQFVEIFGPDAPLAWDPQRGEPLRALLGPAVRAFFAQGGRRCWITRLARAPVTRGFALPWVLRVERTEDGGVRLAQAEARARSPGSGFDALRVATTPLLRGVQVETLAESVASPPLARRWTAALVCDQAPAAGDLLRIESLSAAGATLVTVHARIADVRPLDAIPASASRRYAASLEQMIGFTPWSPAPGTNVVATWPGSDAASAVVERIDESGRVTLALAAPADAAPQPGMIATLDGGAAGIAVADVAPAGGFASPLSPLAAPSDLHVRGAAWRCQPHPVLPTGALRAAIVTLDLDLDDGGTARQRAAGLGLAAGHARYWHALPDDDAFYPPLQTPFTRGEVELAFERERLVVGRDEAGRRLALAGPGDASAPLYVALHDGAGASPKLGALPDARAALVRDGLAEFDARLFVDARLAGVPARQVMDLADALRFADVDAQPLAGIHAALGSAQAAVFEEATLLVAPDAALPGWREDAFVDFIARVLPAPPAPPPDTCGPDFADCAACDVRITGIAARAVDDPDVFELAWTASAPAPAFVVARAAGEDFADAVEVYAGTGTQALLERTSGEAFYRVRAAGSNCPWSATLAIAWRERRGHVAADPEHDAAADAALRATLADVHRAMLRLAAGRGDLLAVLGLPEHFRDADAAAHLDAVKHGLQGDEAVVPGYGAAYHPWVVRSVGGRLETLPPDGPMCGVIAARAIDRGAWIAPGNVPLADVIALTRPVPPERWLPLVERGINVVARQPRGFLPLAADTLRTDDDDVRPINVRRLLILLRRLALARGATYVFEPNGRVLERAVERAFESALGQLYERGAFAGATRAQSFQVVTGPEANTPADADAGRFFVELRVAPALPLTFLTVRLTRSGDRLAVAASA